MYRTMQPLRHAVLWTFMEDEQKDFEFYVSSDGVTFTKVRPEVSHFPTEVNPYGYKLPIQYELTGFPSEKYFLKIVFKGDAQISRVELRHGERMKDEG